MLMWKQLVFLVLGNSKIGKLLLAQLPYSSSVVRLYYFCGWLPEIRSVPITGHLDHADRRLGSVSSQSNVCINVWTEGA